MATVKDYKSGKVLTDTKLAFLLLKFVNVPVINFVIKKVLFKGTGKFHPKLINIKTASELIKNSNKCATGERVCRILYQNSEFTESVFLDELAEGMVNAKKAKYVTCEEAISTLKKYPENPLILSKVSGKYMEICRSSPATCIYWSMERCGLKCLKSHFP